MNIPPLFVIGLVVGAVIAAGVATWILAALYNRIAAAANDLPLVYVNVPSPRYWVLPAHDWEPFVKSLAEIANGNDVIVTHNAPARKFIENYFANKKDNSPVVLCSDMFVKCPICGGQAPQEGGGEIDQAGTDAGASGAIGGG